MQCEYYALEGLSDLVQTVKKVRAHLNPRLEIEGLLRTMYDPRNTLAQNVARRAREAFRREALSHRDPAQHPPRRSAVARHRRASSSSRKSKGALAYLALAGEMLRRMEAARAARG